MKKLTLMVRKVLQKRGGRQQEPHLMAEVAPTVGHVWLSAPWMGEGGAGIVFVLNGPEVSALSKWLAKSRRELSPARTKARTAANQKRWRKEKA